jgi:nicotinate-nucleotide pyrophosphorylase (carboxylating)
MALQSDGANGTPPLELPEGIDPARFRWLVETALAEDLGYRGDLTTLVAGLLGDARAEIVARQAGVFCGGELLDAVLTLAAPHVAASERGGDRVAAGARLATLIGPIEEILAVERTLLNFLQRLSGIATLTSAYVEAVAGTRASVYDTRKTVPGWRDLDKYAVRGGGGRNHRHGLHDALLVKDNHLAGVPTDRLAFTLFEMFNRAESLSPPPTFVEVEVDGLDQLVEVLKVVGVNVVLLDNFSIDSLSAAVRMRNQAGLAGKVELEASGGITLSNVRAVAETGVERISIGALTHSAPAFDLSLEIGRG